VLLFYYICVSWADCVSVSQACRIIFLTWGRSVFRRLTYKTLLDVYLLNSNFATLINQKKKRQRERPHVMTIQSQRHRRGEYCISSQTWAGRVAYLSGRQRRPEFGISIKCDSHVFFCYPFGRESRHSSLWKAKPARWIRKFFRHRFLNSLPS